MFIMWCDYTYIYIYIYRERERYIFRERERERERERKSERERDPALIRLNMYFVSIPTHTYVRVCVCMYSRVCVCLIGCEFVCVWLTTSFFFSFTFFFFVIHSVQTHRLATWRNWKSLHWLYNLPRLQLIPPITTLPLQLLEWLPPLRCTSRKVVFFSCLDYIYIYIYIYICVCVCV